MKIEIKSDLGSVLFSGDFSCLADAVKAAVKSYANLSYANLSSANLSYTNLSYAYLSYANLRSANLSYTNLSYANLCSANLRYANLRYANLRYANLSSANLSYTNLSYTDLRYANLSSTNLSSTKNTERAIAMTRILPAGDLIAWKKCRDEIIVKLMVPHTAKRSHAFGRKCRAEFVKVLELSKGKEAISIHDAAVIYRVGKTVRCDKWNDDFTVECGGGIHFYITKEEAIAHQ